MYSSMYKLKNKPLTKSLDPFFWEKWSTTTAKEVFYPVLLPFWGHLGTPKWTQKGPKKVLKGPQVGRMYVSMSKHKNKPLTKSLSPFLQEKWSKTTRKQVFYAVFGHFGAKWIQKGRQRPASRRDVWPNV
jgi:hypothetical protein